MPIKNRPEPPPEIEGEAMLEWERICIELDAAGCLEKTDRAILVLYVEAYDVYQRSMRHVRKFGPVVKWPNGIAGPSPHYKAARETSIQLQKLLADLGLTPAARRKMKINPNAEESAELDLA